MDRSRTLLGNARVGNLPRRKLMISTVLFFVVVSGMATTLMITPKYEATMSIIISRDRIDPQINPSDKNQEITQTAISDEEFNSELELFKSIEVVSGAVKELDLANDRKPKGGTWLSDTRQRIKTSAYDLVKQFASGVESGGAPSEDKQDSPFSVEKAANHVVDNLEVVPTKKSRVIKVTYRDTDPLRAKKTLESIYQKFVDLHVRMNEKPEAEQVFREQTERFNDRLSETTNELKQFDSQNGVTGAEIATQRELLLKQLHDTEAQVNAATAEIAEMEVRINALRSKVDSMPEQIQTSSVSKYVGALDRMKEEQVRLEQQRTDLLQKYKPNSRFVRENEERLQQLRRNIANERENPPEEKSYPLNDLRRRLEGDLNIAQTSLGGLKKREKTLSAQATRLSAELVGLNARSIERDSLKRKQDVNEEAYLLYQKKARENEISEVLNKERVLNFSVVDPPRTDGQQKTPKPLLNLLILIGVGMIAGIGASMVRDRTGQRESDSDFVLSAGELERRSGLPVLMSMPMIEGFDPQQRLRLKAKDAE